MKKLYLYFHVSEELLHGDKTSPYSNHYPDRSSVLDYVI